MSFDISQVLERWPYQSGEVQVRRFKGKDGREKIQLRVDLGILQMNAQGRPDGKRPLGYESLLEFYQMQLQRYSNSHEGDDEGFTLNDEGCAKLHQEAIQYYHRYICLFQLNDFQGVVRDTERNLQAFEFVHQYAESEEAAAALEPFKPQLIMMQARAQSALALQNGQHERAVEQVKTGVEKIREVYRQQARLDLLEQSGEVLFLEAWLRDIHAQRPLTERQKLELTLKDAVGREDYEKAAEVRDALKNLKESA